MMNGNNFTVRVSLGEKDIGRNAFLWICIKVLPREIQKWGQEKVCRKIFLSEIATDLCIIASGWVSNSHKCHKWRRWKVTIPVVGIFSDFISNFLSRYIQIYISYQCCGSNFAFPTREISLVGWWKKLDDYISTFFQLTRLSTSRRIILVLACRRSRTTI